MNKQAAYQAMVNQWNQLADEGVKNSPEGFCAQLLDAALGELELEEHSSKYSPGAPTAEHLEGGWLEELVAEVLELMRERGAKYGPGNISQFGDYGVLVRLSDKLSRMQHSMEHDFADESTEDTWKDIINYGIIGLAWKRGHWPGSFKDPKKTQVAFEDEEFEQTAENPDSE